MLGIRNLRDSFRPTQIGVLLLLSVHANVRAQIPPELIQIPPAATPGGALPQQSRWERFLEALPPIDFGASAGYLPSGSLGLSSTSRVRVDEFVMNVDAALRDHADPVLFIRAQSFLDAQQHAHRDTGFTSAELDAMASRVTTIFRDADYRLVSAQFPEQPIVDGVVHLDVFAGALSEISVAGNRRYSGSRIAAPFDALLGDPVTRAGIEGASLYLEEYPGVDTTLTLQPGTSRGLADLRIDVEEDRLDVRASVDNYGSSETGNGRVRAAVDWFNPAGMGDLLSANLLQTFDPDEGTYGGVRYQLPVGGFEWVMGLSYDKNTYDAASRQARSIGLGGESRVASLFLRKKLARRSSFAADATASLDLKNAKIDNIALDGNDPEDDLTVLTLALDVRGADHIGPGALNQFAIEYHQGFNEFLGSMDKDGDGNPTRRGGSGDLAPGDFTKWILQAQRLQRITENNRFLARLYFQQSDDLLSSIEQLSLGGPNSVRAYPTAEALVDKGGVVSLEWQVQLTGLAETPPETWQVQLAVFGDYGGGKNNDPLPGEEEDVDFSGWGAGLQLDLDLARGQSLQARVDGATQITDRDPSNGDDWQWWGRLEYQFW